MYCNQCEETMSETACRFQGICGKSGEVSDLQDKLLYISKRLSIEKKENKEIDKFIVESLFATITNVNFDKDYFLNKIDESKKFIQISDEELNENIGVIKENDPDLRSLKEIIIYGIKGIAAYLHHANQLDYENQEINDFIKEGLSDTLNNKTQDDLIDLVLRCGEYGVKVMELLDKAHIETFKNPIVTNVKTTPNNKPGILVSGHDLKDLYDLLEQSKDSDIDIYTHGEMLPAHAYPELKKYSHLIGNYGGSWYKQEIEFERFNGPILMTTNCIIPPKDSYKNRIFTTGVVKYPGLKHISTFENKKDYKDIINLAKNSNPPENLNKDNDSKDLTIGFNHNTTLGYAEKIIELIKNKKIKRFIVMAGCDGRQKDRDYYTEFATSLPSDTIILTAGCAKYRFNHLDLGDIEGIPRMIDAGQCNDSYSLVVIALKLKEAFNLENINDLPISYNIAWYEQKAVLVLLSLLHLGIKNIVLGPKLPAFISPNVLKVLIDKFNISKNSDVESDLKKLVG